MMQFRDLNAQYLALQPSINKAIAETLSSGCFIGGEPVQEIEKRFADYVGVKHCVTCANGTDALQLALMAWGINKGDAVFVPDFTFFSSGEVVSAVGATPVFVDVDERTFNMDSEKLRDAIECVEQKTNLVPKAVIAVDLFGLPADYPAIKDVCKMHNLLLLEDGAQGFGGSIHGKMTCSFGDISTTSFFPAKPLGCYGDGGAIFTNRDEWAQLVRSYAVHGKGSMKYDNVRIGMNSRLDTIQASVLNVKLSAFVDFELTKVNEIASIYNECLKDIASARDWILPFVPEGFYSSWAQYTIQFSGEFDRNLVQEELFRRDIPSMVYYPKPMHEQKAFSNGSLCFDGCPTANKLSRTVLSLPMGPYMNESDLDSIIQVLYKC